MKAVWFCLFVCVASVSGESVEERRLIEEGAWHFEKNCTFCHGKDGRGLIGPNLTDLHFLHGSSRADMERVIKNGLPDKGMPVWEKHLSDRKLKSIGAYVWSLRGKNLKGKAAEGKRFDPEKKASSGTKIVSPR